MSGKRSHFFFPTTYAHVVSSLCYLADEECRKALSQGHITRGENHYTIALVEAIRKIQFPAPIQCRAIALELQDEQRFGADVMMVFHHEGRAKVGIFEAKWPRHNVPTHRWDRRVSSRSHFASQIKRQGAHTPDMAAWEMFYNEEAPNETRGLWDNRGSSCVWQRVAWKYQKARKHPTSAWTNADLLNLLQASRRDYGRPGALNLREILLHLLTCREGKPLQLNPDGDLPEPYGSIIPLLRFQDRPDDWSDHARLKSFMIVNGLSGFVQIRAGPDPPPRVPPPPREPPQERKRVFRTVHWGEILEE